MDNRKIWTIVVPDRFLVEDWKDYVRCETMHWEFIYRNDFVFISLFFDGPRSKFFVEIVCGIICSIGWKYCVIVPGVLYPAFYPMRRHFIRLAPPF